jgi:WD40 repeat protein
MQFAALTTTSSLSLPADSYIYRIVSVGATLAAISSDDSLRIIDPSTLQEVSDGIVKNVHAGVTCLERIDNDHNTILTAGRDAAIRCWDLRSGKKTSEFSDGKRTCTIESRLRGCIWKPFANL